MGLRINQNIAAMNAYRNLTVTDQQMQDSLEKLSSGFRINKAADDAAGLSISEGLRSQIGGTHQAINNAQDGISVVQTADGALGEVHSILQRMKDLAVQASNSGSQDTTARTAAQTEFNQLKDEIDRIGNTTSFGNTKLLNGSFGNQAGAVNGSGIGALTVVSGTNDTFKVSTEGVAAQSLTLAAGSYTNDAAGAASLQSALQTSIDGNASVKGLVTATVYHDSTINKNVVSFTRNSSDANTSVTLAAGAANDVLAGLGVTAGTGNVTAGTGGVFQVGANNTAADRINVSISAVNSTTLTGIGSVDLVNNATSAIDVIDNAITSVSTTRANLGAYQNRFSHTISNLSVTSENLSASESRIRDTDMASEMVSFTRAQILTQAGTAMLAQANQAPQQVLQLLRG
ncbi:MAG TPA: flagellin [Acidimicrobiia bacterium]|nr:flagellin [Acidimicrobiia bacterium]HZQ77043.1 flagellin [Acidimicrobiia bacterium]